MAKVWRKLQRADADYAGNVTGKINNTAVADVYSADNKPSKSDVGLSNVDNVQQYSASNKPTKSDVGLSNVANVLQYSSSNKPTKSDVGLGNVVNESPADLKATMELDNVTNESKATMFASPTFTGTATGLSKASVGLGNVDNSLFSSDGKFKGAITKSDGTSVFDPSDGNFTGKIAGGTASDIKSKAEDAKDAIDGNKSITMVGGSLSIGTQSNGVYPFSVDSTGNLKIQDDEFQALADGTVNCKGSFTINQDSSSNSRIELAGSGSGTAEVAVNGANPTFDLGGATPLGTATLHLRRKLTSNQSRIQFRTGSSGTEFCIGNSNNSGLQTQYAIHHGPLWSAGTADERALSFDADGKMGMYANSKTVDGFTFGSDGTNKHVYIKDGSLGINTTPSTTYKLKVDNGRCYFNRGNSGGEIAEFRGLNATKMSVTTSGIDVYGNIDGSGDLDVGGDTTFGGDVDASGQQVLAGWHTKNKIWVTPGMFTINDDNAYGNLGMEGNGGQAKVMYSSLEAYAQVPIPSGYKVTKFRINGTASVTITCSFSEIDRGTVTSCQPPQQCLTNTEYSTYQTPPTADDTDGRYIVLGWHPTTTSQYLFGAYLTIEKA